MSRVRTLAPDGVRSFLESDTPESWVAMATERVPELLNDHANCELKAASTALGFIYRYPERTELCERMSRLAREELRHFEQVRRLMSQSGISFARLSASRYAGTLRASVRQQEPERLLDGLLIGALIEARSCERFAAVAPRLPSGLRRFYEGLLASEARHFENYLALAKSETGTGATAIERRLVELRLVESGLIEAVDDQFRFHSGVPAGTLSQSSATPEFTDRRASHSR